MKVYSVNKGIGYASSGIEYAQKYRKNLFNTFEVDDYYIFLDYIFRNITVYTDLMGYQTKKVVWIYNFLSQRNAEKSTFTVTDFIKEFSENPEVIKRDEKNIEIKVSPTQRYRIWLLESDIIDRVDYIVNNVLVSVRHYDQSLNNIEEYHQGKLVKRVFFNLEGQKSYEQFYDNNGEITVTFIDNHILYGKLEFYQYFFKRLDLKREDAVIIDRPLEVVEGILPVLVNKVRLFSVVHAEHYNENLSKGEHILWNNNYEYVFEHADAFESMIVSTERQNQILKSQLKRKVEIVTIPVGYINKISRKKTYKPFSLITASRLAPEKHIDVLIKAAVLAKKTVPQLTLDIYGEGSGRIELEKIIKEHGASNYIRLQGHQDLDEIYSRYSGYVSASTSEGFGLSLLEALGAGLPLIGVDVEYGNREFIDNGENGILYNKTELKKMPETLALAIEQFFEKKLDEKGRAVSKQKAKSYLKENVAQMWQVLLEREVKIDGN